MITIAIPTFNRLPLIKEMAKSLYASDIDTECCNIRVYDDCSTDFDIETLRIIFPNAITIMRHENNLRADRNMHFMYKDFLNYDDQLFLNADSDLLFSKNWLSNALMLIDKTSGVLSLFNTPEHKQIQEFGTELIKKNDIGAAGTLFTRQRLQEIIEQFPEGIPMFDWAWCDYLSKKSIPIYCVKDSLVQHIGIVGQNSISGCFDYGESFVMDSIENARIIDRTFFTYIQQMKSLIIEKERLIKASREYYYGEKVVAVIKFFKKVIKKIMKRDKYNWFCNEIGRFNTNQE